MVGWGVKVLHSDLKSLLDLIRRGLVVDEKSQKFESESEFNLKGCLSIKHPC